VKRLLIVLCLLAASAASAAPLSEAEFTREFVARASAQLKDRKFDIVGPLQVHTQKADGEGEMTINLDNAYARYKSDPAALDRVVADHISVTRAPPEAADAASDASIMAVLKPTDYLVAVGQQLAGGGSGNDLIFKRLNDDLVMVYVFDTENSMRLVMKKDLEKRKMNADTLHALAVKNLAAFFDTRVQIERFDNTGDARLYGVALDQNYEASTLLLEKYWNKQTFDVRGDIVVFVPARDTVLVTGSQDKEGLRIAARVAEKAYQELAYTISPLGYVYRAGKWQRFKP
jgi:uncharacterized protein YtpQ (UPF0354 family)